MTNAKQTPITELAKLISKEIEAREGIKIYPNVRYTQNASVVRMQSPFGENKGSMVKIVKTKEGEYLVSLMIWIPVTNDQRLIGWNIVSTTNVESDTNLELVSKMAADHLLNKNLASFEAVKFPCRLGTTIPTGNCAAALIVDSYEIRKYNDYSIVVYDVNGKSALITGKNANILRKTQRIEGKYLVMHEGGLIRLLTRERFEGVFQPVDAQGNHISYSDYPRESASV